MKTLIIILAGAMLFAACSATAKNESKNEPVDYKLIAEGQHSRADTASVYLMDNSGQWAEAWNVAYANVEPMPELPKIDFTKNMVLAAFMGQKNSGGYKIEISGLQLKNDTLNVNIANHSRAGGMMLPVITSPFQFVEVPRGKYKLEIKQTEVKE